MNLELFAKILHIIGFLYFGFSTSYFKDLIDYVNGKIDEYGKPPRYYPKQFEKQLWLWNTKLRPSIGIFLIILGYIIELIVIFEK